MISLSQRRLFGSLLFGALFLLSFRFDGAPAGYDIDPSWSAVMSWGWATGVRWGSDLVFSYGPFSFLSPHTSFVNEIFPTTVIGQLSYSASFVALAFLALRSARFATCVLAGLCLLVYGNWLAGDVCWLLGYPLALLALRRNADIQRRHATLNAIFIGCVAAVPCVVKFSLVPLWPVWMGCVLGLRIPMRLRLASICASATAILLFWLGSGNNIVDLLRYLETGMEIATGYGSAMQRPPKHWSSDVFGLALLALTLSAIIGNSLMRATDGRENMAWTILLSTVAILAFKAGYTRVDTIHLMIFLPVACSLALLATEWPGDNSQRTSVIAAFGVFIFSVVSIWNSEDILATQKTDSITGNGTFNRLIFNMKSVALNSELRQSQLHEQYKLERDLDLPQTRARIAGESVDILPAGQGLVFRNGMNYRPRPVFQGYFSYTPRLADLNITYWRSEKAPVWVLLNLSSIDHRLLGSEDGASLLELLSRYRLQSQENGMMVFHRATPQLPQSQERDFQDSKESLGFFGQLIPVPESVFGATTMALTARPSWAGRLAALILREPRIFLLVESMEGETKIFRLVRGSAQTRFLISPLLTNNAELTDWLAGEKGKTISAVSLFAEKAFGMPAFEDSFTIRWGEFQPLR